MKLLLDIIAWCILALAFMKIIDMFIYSIIWNLKNGKRYCDRFHYYLSVEKYSIRKAIKKIGKYNHDPMKIAKYIGGIPPKCIFKFIANYIYRWPSLVFLLSIILFFVPNKLTALSVCVALLVMVIAEVIHQLVSRLTLGVADNINKYAYFNVVDSQKPEKEIWHVSRILKDSVLTLFIQIFCITVSFSSIFWVLEKFYNIFKSENIIDSPLDTIYFSLVTITTVGYGDITPVEKLGRFVSIIQIGSVWILVALLFTHYLASLSVKIEDRSSKRLYKNSS